MHAATLSLRCGCLRGNMQGTTESLHESPAEEEGICPVALEISTESLGQRLHRTVPPDYWCINKTDLTKFRATVQHAVAEGRVKPTDRDRFDPEDTKFGPRIHAVNAQLIKPVTAAAGDVSWALMLRPEGLKCDLFITHCWKEGIFEFLDKVLNSWPLRAKNAYCCFLSNPQNLNIGVLIDTPRNSPFAIALQASTYMLAVPNETCSIYSRIWCAYEAHLAHQCSKRIFTASAPIPHLWWSLARTFTLAIGVFCTVLALLSTILPVPPKEYNDVRVLPGFVGICFILSTSFLGPSRLSAAFLYLGTVFMSSAAAVSIYVYVYYPLHSSTAPIHPTYASNVFLQVVLCIAAAVGEADRLYLIESLHESSQLRHGYTGKLQDAVSSHQEDRDAIMRELEANEEIELANQAVEVLLCSGMSTSQLQTATARAGRLQQAGHWNLSLVISTLLIRIFLDLSILLFTLETLTVKSRVWLNGLRSLESPWAALLLATSVVGLLGTVAWMLLFRRLDADMRGFAAAAMVKIMGTFTIIVLIFPLLLVSIEPWSNPGYVIMVLGAAPLVILMSAAGPGRTARIHVLGSLAVRCLMAEFSCRWRKTAY